MRDCRVNEVELLDDCVLVGAGQLEVPTLLGVKKRCEDRGESKRGAQNQSIFPSRPTNAVVCRSPMSPWSAIGGYAGFVIGTLLPSRSLNAR